MFNIDEVNIDLEFIQAEEVNNRLSNSPIMRVRIA